MKKSEIDRKFWIQSSCEKGYDVIDVLNEKNDVQVVKQEEKKKKKEKK